MNRILHFIFFTVFSFINRLPAQSVIYIDSAATGLNNGSSWTNAYTDFQTGVHAAGYGDSVFVAKGTYQPASGQRFSLKEGVKIYGGFAGTETSFSQRNLSAGYNSILKGNGRQVISDSVDGLTTAAVLDGFIITGGQSTGLGGGIALVSVSPILQNLVLTDNGPSGAGGAMAIVAGPYSPEAKPVLINVLFYHNNSGFAGGGALLINGSPFDNTHCAPVLINITFADNQAPLSYGGALLNISSSPVFYNTIFWNNIDHEGHADVYDESNSAAITYSYMQTTLSGTGNIQGTSNPFVDDANAVGPDGKWMTADDGLILASGSNAVNGGTPDTTGLNLPATDLAGHPRISGSTIDMGAIELQETSLPVTLLSFTGMLDNATAQLQWQTIAPIHIRAFSLEKSIDGQRFFTIASIAVQGNNNDYAYNIPQPESLAYYRLQIVDDNGTFTYSPIQLLIQNNQENNGTLLYPNPARDQVQIITPTEGIISFYNASGQLLLTQLVQAGITVININHLNAGTYYVIMNKRKMLLVKQ